MVNSCGVRGCHNVQSREKDRRYFSKLIPIVVTNRGREMKVRTDVPRRRREWLAQLRLKNLTFDADTRYRFVCSDHFVNGVAAYVRDVNSPNWKPTLKLGHGACTEVSAGRVDRANAPMTSEGLVVRDSWLYTDDAFIPIWESNTHVLALVSGDDGQVAPELADKLYSRYPKERRHLIRVVHYPGAGHLLEPPIPPTAASALTLPRGQIYCGEDVRKNTPWLRKTLGAQLSRSSTHTYQELTTEAVC